MKSFKIKFAHRIKTSFGHLLIGEGKGRELKLTPVLNNWALTMWEREFKKESFVVQDPKGHLVIIWQSVWHFLIKVNILSP